MSRQQHGWIWEEITDPESLDQMEADELWTVSEDGEEILRLAKVRPAEGGTRTDHVHHSTHPWSMYLVIPDDDGTRTVTHTIGFMFHSSLELAMVDEEAESIYVSNTREALKTLVGCIRGRQECSCREDAP